MDESPEAPESRDSRIYIEGLRPGDVALLRDLAEAAAEKTANKIFTAMGLNTKEPLESQKSFAFLRAMTEDVELSADMSWLRKSRLRSEGLIGKAMTTAMGIIVLSAMWTIWAGIQSMLRKVGVP